MAKLQMIAMVFWAALAQAATLPEVEKPAADWTAALLAWLEASFRELSHG
jgi:hypothetical protein